MPKPVDVVVAGHLCLDVIPDLSHIAPEQFVKAFVPGRLVQVGDATFGTGGPVSNVGLAMHKLGSRVQLMGKVGQDAFGTIIRQIVSSYGAHLADGMVVDPSAHSSYTVVINPPGIDRYFLHFAGANDTFSAADVRYELLPDARLFHFGYPPLMRLMLANRGAQLAEVFRRAKATGITTSLDMAMPDPSSEAGRADWPAILAGALPYVDVFLPSIEEILFMARRSTFDALERAAGGHDILPLVTPQLLAEVSGALLEMGTKVVGLKLGNRGFYLRTAGQAALQDMGRAGPPDPAAWAGKELWAPCFQANEVGTVGSGDATIAGFLTGLLHGISAEEAVTAAVAVGACNVEAADTLSGIRSWQDTMQRVAAGWSHHPLELDAPGWHMDQARGMWIGPG